jgi:hypothetical protein
MKAIEISEALKPLSDYALELDEEVIVLTSNKEPIAALVSLKNVDRESLALSTSPEFMEIIEAARREFRSGKRLSLDGMKRQVLE